MSIAHDNVKAKYQNIAYANEQKLKRRKEEIYKKSPDVKKLEDKILSLNLESLKLAIVSENSQSARKEIEKKKTEIEKKIEQAIKKLGYKKDYLNEIYTCKICKDTGYTDQKIRCDCYHRYMLEERTKGSGLSKNSGTFETFDLGVFNKTKHDDKMSQAAYMKELKTRAENYADEFPDGKTLNFIIMGKPGTGKTYLIEAILNRVLKRGFVGEYFTASRLFTMFYNHRLGERIDLDVLFDLPILVLDDLGTEIMTKNVTVEYFYNLINERTVRGKHTVAATNLASANIADRYGDRVLSRLCAKNAETFLIPDRFSDIRL